MKPKTENLLAWVIPLVSVIVVVGLLLIPTIFPDDTQPTTTNVNTPTNSPVSTP